MLEVKNLTVRYGELFVVKDVSFEVKKGEWLMIAGPNGAGKSTIINAISQGAQYTGEVTLNGENVRRIKPNALAHEMGVLMQSHSVGYSFTVEEIVGLGRYAYSKGVFAARGDDDIKMIDEALDRTGMSAMRKHSILTLSGGELQRTFLAQVFAQDPKLLLLDEPTNHLDLKYQMQIFSLIREWLKTPGRAVISVVHDLSLARAYGTKALLLNSGKIEAYGDTDTALSREHLKYAYEMDVFSWMNTMLRQWENEQSRR